MNPSIGPTGKPGNKFPSGYKQYQLSNYTPEQMGLHQSQYQHVDDNSFLSKLAMGDEETYNQLEAPAFRDFNKEIGNISSRFSGFGTGGRHSSGFQNTMGAAASNFAQDLQANRIKTRMKALEELMSFSDRILGQKPYETGLVKKEHQPSGWGSAIGAGVGATGGYFAGGFPGALQGAQFGYDVGSQF